MALEDTAKSLVEKFGRRVTLSRTATTPNVTEPWKPGAQSTTTQSVFAVFDNDMGDDFMAVLTQVAGRGDQERTGLNARMSKVYVAAKGVTITLDADTQIIDGDETLEITDFELIQPGVTPYLYVLQVQR